MRRFSLTALMTSLLCAVLPTQVLAATLTWTGALSDDWSVAANYAESGVPGAGDTVIFNASSDGNSAPQNNSPAELANVTIDGAYTAGDIRLSQHLHITGNLNFANSTNTLDLNSYNLTVDGTFIASQSYDTQYAASALDINNLSITGGTFTNRGTLQVSGNFSNAGTAFTSPTGTVVLDSTATASVSGNNSFNNLTITTAGKTVNFTAGTTQTVNGLLSLAGASGNLLTLRSSSGGSQWDLNLQGTASTTYVDVQDGDASAGNSIGLDRDDSTDSGNNLNWFAPSPPAAGGDITATDPAGGPVSIAENSGAPGAANIRITPTTLSDADGSTPDSIRFLSVDGGSLAQANGSAITLGASGTVLGLTAGNLDVRFTPSPGRNTDATIAYVVVDPEGLSDSVSSTITVSILASASPIATGAPSDVTVVEDVLSDIDFSTMTISDADSPTLTVTLTASNGSFATPADGAGVGSGVTASLDSATVISLVGSPADISSYLDTASNLQYTTASNASGDDVATITVVANEGDGSGDLTLATVNVDATAVNDDPVVSTLPAAVAVSEDTQGNIDLSVASFSDVDSASITVRLSASAGSFAAPADGAAVGGGVTETQENATTITLLGTPADISSYLSAASNLQYTAVSNSNGVAAATITVTANDGDGSGDVALGTVNINVTAVNDLPVFSGLDGTPSFTEGGAAVLLDSDVSVSDVELDALNSGNGDYAGASLVIVRNGGANLRDSYSIQSGGNLSVAGSNISAAGNVIAGFDTSSAGQLTVTFQNNGTFATTALVNEVMQAIRYSNTSNDPAASVQLNWSFSDGNSANAQGTGDNPGTAGGFTTASITNINDAPTLSATGRNPTYVEGAGAVDLFNTVAASTVEALDRISSLSLTVTNVSDGASEILGFDGSDVALTDANSVTTATNALSVTVSVTGSTATVSFSGATLSSAQSQTLVDALTYHHTSDNPTTAGNRVLTITGLVDNGGTAGGGFDSSAPNLSSTVSLTAVNDPPVIANFHGDNNPVTPGSSANIDLDSDATVSNADSADYNGGSLSITDLGGNNTANGNFAVDGVNVRAGFDETISAGESIEVSGVSIGTVHASDDGQGGNNLTINFNGNANEERVQSLLRNLSWGAAAGNGAQTFTATLNDADGTANSGDQDVTANFTMTLSNAPSLGGTPADASIDEDTPTAIDLSAYTISDADGDPLTLTLAVTSGSLASSSAGGVTVGSSGSASMTLQGSVANLNSFLDDATKVVYSPLANSNAAVTLTVTPNDGLIDGAADTVTIDINPVDDPPENTVPGAQTGVDGTASAIAGASIADIDSASLTTTLTAANGAAAVSEAGGATVTGNNSGSVSITGSVAQINAALAGMSYTPDVNSSGAQTLQLATNDGTTTDTDSITITVADRPTIENLAGSVTFNKGSSGELLDASSDALVSDADSLNFNGGHLTLSITAGAVPAEDLLTFDTSGSVSLAGTTAGSNVLVAGTVVGSLGNNVAAGNDLVVNLNADATPARLSTLVQALQYQNLDSANATSGSRSISLTLSDGVNEGSASLTLSIPAPASNDPDEGQEVSGDVENTGTLSDVTINENASLNGGSLDGEIENNGTISNVQLTPGTTITGGLLAGTISGDPLNPALLNSQISADSFLENVVLGAQSTLDPDASLGANVRFESSTVIPPNMDLTAILPQMSWQGGQGTPPLLNLDNSIFDGQSGNAGESLLGDIQLLDDFAALGNSAGQNPASGELELSFEQIRANLLPVSMRQAPAGTPPGTTINADGDVSIVTSTGQQIISYPAMVDLQSLRDSTAGASLRFDGRANLLFSTDDSGDEVIVRPGAIAVPASPGSAPGLVGTVREVPANVPAYSLIFEDDNGQFMQQEVFPVPGDWPALKTTLEDVAGAGNVSIDPAGVLSVELNGLTVRAVADYRVQNGGAGNNANVEFAEAGDLNDDGIPDFLMIYPDGRLQNLYVLP